MANDTMIFAAGIVGIVIAATVLVLGFALGEIFEIVVIGAILLLLCPIILAWVALRD